MFLMFKLKVIFIALLLLLAVSFLGGSAIWHVLGIAPNLDIKGQAKKYHSLDVDLGEGWPVYGGDQGGNRYSTSDQITLENVSQLELAWTYRTAAFENREKVRRNSAFQTTPILINDKLIFCSQYNDVIAVDPFNGQEQWRYNYQVDREAFPANGYKCRGVSHWKDTSVPDDQACSSRVLTRAKFSCDAGSLTNSGYMPPPNRMST